MERNMGVADRLIQVLVALIICSFCVDGRIRGRTDEDLLLIFSVILAFSSLLAVSPFYWLFRFNTYNENEMQDD
jgi:hypothetical protein